MKKNTSILLLFLVTLGSLAQSPSFKTYMNPVIPGDHPDCTVTKIGNDYYTTGSSFNVTPVIYHSTNLVHWEAVAQPVSATWSGFGDKAGGGCWGGQMVLHNGKYWNYFSRGNIMHYTKADSPEGPWSMPVKVNDPVQLPYGLGYDNSIFIDDDNKWYLVVKNGQPNGGIVELGDDGQATGVVYDLNWLNPSPELPYSWAEGPVMWKYEGFYYYSFARDLAGGQKVMRSRTITADESAWEMLGDFFNENDPQKPNSLFSSPNHASQAVLINDSISWIIHPLYAKGEWRGQGRQGLLNQVRYDANNKPVADYPINDSFTAPNLPTSDIPWMVPKSDFFSSDKLNPEWSFLGNTAADKSSLTDRFGWLRLSSKSASKANTVIKNDGEHSYALITRIDFSPESNQDAAGLWIMRGDEIMDVKLVSTISIEGTKEIVFSFNGNTFNLPNNIGDTLWLKIERVNHVVSGYCSSNRANWKKIGDDFNIAEIDAFSDYSTFTGTRQGLYVKGKKDAFFDLYIYRDAYSPILAECPANQFGTSKGATIGGTRPLINIHANDWALYAGVEFGNGDYFDLPDSIEFIASSASEGGKIEVWLDSIDTGTKISECIIASTGSFNEYKTFKAKVDNVSRIHDVYLRFTGTESEKLFQLKWMKFLSKSDATTTSSSMKGVKGGLNIYPNPTKDQFCIASNLNFNKISIIDMNGKIVQNKNFEHAINNTSISINLNTGLYLVKVSDGALNETSKIFVK